MNAEDLGPILARGTADDPAAVPEQEPFQFQVGEDEEPTLETFVFQALGAASGCWDSLKHAGVFDSTRAKEIGDLLCEVIRHITIPIPSGSYSVEIGGQHFTKAQWEAVQTYIAGTSVKTEGAEGRDLLLAYGEWLDDEDLQVRDKHNQRPRHDDLVDEFLEQRTDD